MGLEAFDFELPPERIALRPARPRDAARLLVVTPGAEPPLADRSVRDLPALLRAGDLLVMNDTRVIPARLTATRARGEAVARVEVMLHTRAGPDRWRAFLRPAKKVAPGERLAFGGPERGCALTALDATVVERGEGGDALLAFDLSGPVLDEAVAALGTVPLPPYVAAQRAPDEADRADYQTVYAREPGAVAAPTAGLHLTEALLETLSDQGVEPLFLTLHVGAGTFLPVKAEDPEAHVMHAEAGHLAPEAAERLNAARAAGRRIVAVGTTSLRLLESALGEDGRFRPFAGETAIFLRPGVPVRAADGLLTNFHLPRSTLFMLVCAFAGTDLMRGAYAHAIRSGYRFYSYGDASLLWRR